MRRALAAAASTTELLITGLPQDLSPEQLGTSPIRRAIDECALGTNATATQVRDYIANLHDFVGMNGIYDFRIGDQHGVTSASLVVTRWDAAAGAFRAVTGLGNPLR